MIDGTTYWYSASLPTPKEPSTAGFLLPIYDEYTIAYKHHSAILDPQYAALTTDRLFTSAYVYKGELIGMWRRTFSNNAVLIEIASFRPFTADEHDAFVIAAQRFGTFYGVPVVLG